MNNVKDTVLKKIQNGEVCMRPRWHFVLKSLLLLVGVVLAALWTVYLLSFLIFVLVETGALFLPMFGVAGLEAFLLSAPWLLIIVALIFVLVLEYLVSCYAFSYRTPLLYTALGIMFLTVLGAFLVWQSEMHETAMERVQEGRVPFVGPMYRTYSLSPYHDVHVGVISGTTTLGFRITSRLGETYDVIVDDNTIIPPIPIGLGQAVLIMGELEEGVIKAAGVRPHIKPTRRGELHFEGAR